MSRSLLRRSRLSLRSQFRRASHRRIALCLASAIAAGITYPTSGANSELDVSSGASDLTAAGSYTQNTAPTTTSDVTFQNIAYPTPTTFTISGTTNLSIGSLNDLDAQSQTLTIQNGTNSTTAILTLNGGDSVSGNTSDLLYVASGANLSIVGTQGTGAVLNLALAQSGNFDIAGTASISSIISGAFGITKTGSGTLTLTGANTFSGGLTITAGTVKGSLVGSFGTGAITLNGGTLSNTAAITFTQAISIGAGGGTIDNQNAGKDIFGTTGQLTGAGTLTRTGAAVAPGSSTNLSTNNDVFFSNANTGFTGPVILNGGITELGANALGTGGATNTITINTGAELVTNANLANNLIINGGILSGDNGNRSINGTVTVNGPFAVRLGDFYQATSRSLTLAGNMSGTGAITFIGAQATTAGAGQTLFLNGNNTAYTSNINAPAGYNVSFGTLNSFGTGTVSINSTATSLGGFGVGYDFGATLPAFTNNLTGTSTGGVFGINTALASTTTLDLSALGGGGMLLGSQSAGTYAAPTLTPNGSTYTLGGGGGTLTFSAAALSGANNVVVGDTRTNGAGTIAFSAAEPYTGTTTITAGSTLQLAGTAGAIPNVASGSITDNGTFAVNRTNAVAQGTDFPNNIAGSGGVNMIGSGTLTLAAGNTYTGPTTITAGRTILATTTSLPSASVPTFNGSGTLDLNGLSQSFSSFALAGTATLIGTITNGSLTLNPAAGFTLNSVATSNVTQRIDMSGLSQFTFNQPTQTFQLGDNAVVTSATPVTDLKLSATSNLITAGTLVVGFANGNNTTAQLALTTLDLGASNSINANTINIGQYRDSGTVAFQSGLTTPSVVFRGASGGTSAVNLLQLGESTSGALVTVGTLDTTLGTVDAIVNSFVVGNYDPGGANVGSTGIVKMTAGTMNIGTLTLGTAKNANTTGTPITATFTQNAGSVLASTLTMGVNVSGDTTPKYTSTYNLGTTTTSGTLLASSIKIANTGTNTASQFLLVFNNGTIENYDPAGFLGAPTGSFASPQNLTITGVTGGGAGGAANATMQINLASTGTHALLAESGQTITLAPTALLADVATQHGTLALTGPGTVIFQGAHTYTGATSVNAGTLQLAANGANLASAVTVANGATLSVTPGSAGASNSIAGLTLSAGSNLTLSDGFINSLSVAGPGSIAGFGLMTFDIGGATTAADSITATGTNAISNTGINERIALNVANNTTSLTSGDYPLITSGSASMTPADFVLTSSKIFVGSNEYSLSLADSTPTTIFLSISPFTGLDAAYWTGSQDNNWTTQTGGAGGATNFATDATGTTNTNALPGSQTDVFFAASGATNTNPTNLGASFAINSLNFLSGSPAVVIDSDSNSPTSTTNTLTLNSSQVALNDASSNDQTINAPVVIPVPQTWTNSGTGTLTVASASAGANLLTVNGSGTTNINSFSSSTGGLTASGSATVTVGTATLTGAQTWTNNSSNPLAVSTALNTGANAIAFAGTGAINIANYTGSGGITVSGSATVNLSGTTTPSANETFTNNSSNLLTISGTALAGGTAALTFTGTGNTTVSAPITGSGAYTKSGAATLTLSGGNANAAGTTILGGTVASGIDNALSSGSLVIGDSSLTASTATGSVNLSAFNQTLSSLNIVTNNTTVNQITVAAGKTLTINGTSGLTVGFNLGASVPTADTATSLLTITGGGSLVVNNASASVLVGVSQSTQLSTPTANTLDVSGLSNVALGTVANPINLIRVGYGQTAGGTLVLSNTANTLVATTIDIGNSKQANGGPGLVTLGTGTNVIDATTLDIGFSKISGTLKFASQTAGSPGTITIANKAGTGGAAIFVGDVDTTMTSGGATGLLDLRGHTATVNASTLTIGLGNSSSNVSNATGTVDFDTGTFTVGTLVVAQKSGASTGATTGTLNVSGGAFTVNTAFTLGNQSGSGSATANLNVTGGTFTSNANIAPATTTAVSTITLDGGTLDLTGHTIGSATVPVGTLNFRSGTLKNVAEINNGAASLTKTTAGTLILSGTNAYSGGTVISAGTLRAESTSGSSTGSGAVAVNSTGILAGSGKIAGVNAVVGVNSGATITAGTGATSSDTPGLLTTTGGPADPSTITASAASQVWNDGGAFAWKFDATAPSAALTNASTDPAGPGSHWDMLSMTSLSVQVTSNAFTINPVALNGASLSTSANPYTIADITSGWVQVGAGPAANYASNPAALAAALTNAVVLPASYTTAGYSLSAISDGNTGDDIIITFSPAPEPTSLALLGFGAAGLLLRRRRRGRAI